MTLYPINPALRKQHEHFTGSIHPTAIKNISYSEDNIQIELLSPPNKIINLFSARNKDQNSFTLATVLNTELFDTIKKHIQSAKKRHEIMHESANDYFYDLTDSDEFRRPDGSYMFEMVYSINEVIPFSFVVYKDGTSKMAYTIIIALGMGKKGKKCWNIFFDDVYRFSRAHRQHLYRIELIDSFNKNNHRIPIEKLPIILSNQAAFQLSPVQASYSDGIFTLARLDQYDDTFKITQYNIPDPNVDKNSMDFVLKSLVKHGDISSNIDDIIDFPFDHIYIINLDDRSDRWERMQQRLIATNIPRILWSRFSAIRPNFDNINPVVYNRYNIDYATREATDVGKYIIGASGCKLSHIACIREARKLKYESILILEDDSYFTCDPENISYKFKNIISELPENWEIMQLAGNHFDGTFSKYSEHLIQIKFSLTTLAYAIHSRAYDIVLNAAENSGLEIDMFYASYIQSRGNSYCITPHLCNSDDDYSDILCKFVSYKCIATPNNNI